LIDKNKSHIKRIEPFLNKTLWQIEGNFAKAHVSVLGKQMSVISPFANHQNIKLIDIETGKIIKDFDLPQLKNAVFQEVFETKEKQILLHFQRPNYAVIATNEFDYWVCYDVINKKPLWRTDFHSESLSSILPLLN
jgi:hypothetical protein